MVATLSSCLILIVLTVGVVSGRDLEKPGDSWLRMTKSERVNYLVGYVHGVDTIVTADEDYKGTVVEDILYSSQKLKKAILKRVTELYRNKANRGIFWNHMLLLACMELEGESRDIVEQRLVMFRSFAESYFGKGYEKPGNSWLLLPQADRSMYLKGLIEGIRTGIILREQKDSRTITLYEDLFSVGAETETVADIVTGFFKDPANRIIDYRFLFPVAFMKFKKAEESAIKELLNELRNTEKKRRLPKSEKGSDTKETIESFEKEIQEQEDQLFGITLYFEGIRVLWAHDKDLIEMNRIAFKNIMERGNSAIRHAKQLLNQAKKDPTKVKLLRQFVFPPIHGFPILDEMTKRAKIYVETYNELFPGRPRKNPLTPTEHMLLMKTAVDKWEGKSSMSSNKISEVAELLYSIAHSQITDNINFIQNVCEEIYQKHQPFGRETRNKIGLEFMALYLHITSRKAFSILGEDKAWQLIEAQTSIFKDHMMGSGKAVIGDKREDVALSLELMLRERHSEYGKYKAFPEKDEGPKDTLFWEFGKHICEAAGHPMDIRLIVAACSQAFAFVEAVDWEEILGQAK